MVDEAESTTTSATESIYRKAADMGFEEEMKNLKNKLNGWKQVLQPLYSALIWEQSYYPAILTGIVTLIFILLWYFEPSVLTTFSLLGIVVCVADYAVPIMCSTFLDASKWTETQENKHEEICKAIIQTKQQTSELWSSFIQLRDTMPKLYFVSVLVILLVVAWIGNVVDSMLLTYFLVLAIVMMPGLKHQGIIQKFISQRAQQLKNILGQKLKKN
ncbi:ADP-ribosylation factor-like protein 6-interacting protein 1 isoform X2 [Limulus polyphemus]|uniref:ADP-ribosylation factor-like protein 6-interacting protein 1 isoform X2 n=1 Tax=Limulus polyphemus TaxID=6850 RepID=A0ABM1BM76_LIMPO|nr:ADP-ribosylation factor-like protein 6-interacting protein 1 isoform X2 [Limulus polyphemus]